MKLRKLEEKDAPFMMEWMHDPSVVENLQADFASMQMADCARFIELAQDTTYNLHLAIVDDTDEYQGTVSLKHISGRGAEFAIVVRKSAMGKSFSEYGMEEVLRIAFEMFGLDTVYWCASPRNRRACRFYEKQGFGRFDIMEDAGLYRDLVQGGVPARTDCWLLLVPEDKESGRGGKQNKLNIWNTFLSAVWQEMLSKGGK